MIKQRTLDDCQMLDIMFQCFVEAENAILGCDDISFQTFLKIQKKMLENHDILAKHLGLDLEAVRAQHQDRHLK